MKATAIAPANIALIKYWGKKDPDLRLPENNSIAINQSNLSTTTTVEFSKKYLQDHFQLLHKNKNVQNFVSKRVFKHLGRIREIAGVKTKARVVSKNNFPIAAGLASSASGFAALTVAATKAASLNLSEKELSILARQASGSACRSIPDGFVEWIAGSDNGSSYAYSLYPPDYWDISILAVMVDEGAKEIGSTEGHRRAGGNPFLRTRLSLINRRIEQIKKHLQQKDFQAFGKLVESEALELHAVMLTSTPPLIYWKATTIEVMHAVRRWRRKGLYSYFTIDAGPHLHIICKDKDTQELTVRLRQVGGVKDIIISKPSKGARLSNKHLF